MDKKSLLNGNLSEMFKLQVGDIDVHEYKYPKGKGSFTGTLVVKNWSYPKSLAMVCFFDTDEGNKYKLVTKYPENTQLESDVNMHAAEYGTRWTVSYSTSIFGKTKWLTAVPDIRQN